MVEPREIRVNCMATDIANSETVQGQPIAIGEPRWVRVALISVTLLFLGIFLFLPLIVVFTEAFKKGVEVYFRVDPRAGCRERHPTDFDRGRDCCTA